MELQQQINVLESRQLELRAVMASSDGRAAKCDKTGASFRETYPEDFGRYEAANAEYNANELTLARLQAEAEREAERIALEPPMEIISEPETEPETESETESEAEGEPEIIPEKPVEEWHR